MMEWRLQSETRDVMLCTLYVLQRLPKRILGAIWLQQSSHGNLIRLLELALNVFCYRGRRNNLQKTSNK